MSQVRKFDKGGSTAESTEKKSYHDNKYGHYIVDGKTYDVNDDFINNYITSAKKFNDAGTNRIASYVINALKSGQDVSFDTLNNRVTGINQYLNTDDITRSNEYYSGSQNNKMRRKYQRKEINKNTDLHQTNVGIKNLGSIQFTNSEEPVESPKLIDLYGEDRTLDYNKNADGSVTWSTGPQNAGNVAAINNFFDFLGMSNEEADKKYGYKGKENWINDLRNWYINNPNYKEGLISRMKSNQLDGNDWDVLSRMGFIRDENSNNSSSSISTTQPRSYEGSGFNNDALEQAGYYILKDSNGNPVLYDNNRKVVRNNIYLKDFAWAADSPWKNGAWYQGKFYTNDELLNQDNAANNAFQAYVNASTVTDENGNWNPDLYRQALKQTGWIYAGMNDPNPYTKYQDPNKTLLPGFEHITNPYYFQDISSEFTTPTGTTIISYLDTTHRNKDGSPSVKYAVSDDPTAIFDTQEQLQTYLNGLSTPITKVTGIRTPREDIFQPEYESDGTLRYLKSKILAKVLNNDGSILEASVYKGNDGNYYFKGQNNSFYKIHGSTLMDKILKGQNITQKEYEFGMDENDKMSWFRRNILGGNLEIGINPYFKPKAERYTGNQYDTALGFKTGGKIPILQFGGIVSRIQTGINKGASSDDKIGTLHRVGGGPGLTDASDKWATAATMLDTASLGTSFIPGVGNVVGALTGLGGSVSRFVSDIKRDGFDAGDLGRFGINLGLDALTLIPFAGSAAKATKLAKAGKATVKAAKNTTKVAKAADKTKDILSSSDVLGNIAGIDKFFKPGEKMRKVGRAAEIALPAVGTVSGINAAIDAAKDGEITTDEMASIASGIMSGALLGRGISRALDRKALKVLQNKIGIKSNAPEYKATFKNKDGADVTVTLTKDDLASLKGKRKKTLVETLESKIKNAGGDLEKTGIKAEDLIDRFKLPMKDGVISGINKNWNKLNLPKEKKLDVFSTEALSNKELAKTLQGKNLDYWTNRAAKAYQYGLSRNSDALNTIQRLTEKTLIATPRTTFGGWGLQWDLSPALKKATTSRTGRQLLSKMYHSGVRDLSSAKRYVTTNLSPDKQKYWMDLLNTRGKEFDDLFKKLATLTGDATGRVRTIDSFKFKKGGKIIKAQNGVKWNPGDLVMDNNLIDPNLYDYQSHGISFNGSNVDWAKTYAKNSQFDQMRQNYINNWNNPEFNSVKQAYLNQLSSNNNNIDVSDFSLDDFKKYTSDQKLGWAHKLNTDAYKQFNRTLPAATVTATKSILPQITGKAVVQNQSNPIISQINSRLNNTPITGNSNENSTGNDTTGVEKKNWFNFNPDDLIGGLELARSLMANNRMYGELKDANRAVLREMPTEIYDRYQDHITPIYQEAANQKRQFFVPISTDATINYAMRQANEDAVQALLTEGRLKASEAYSQYLDKDLAARRAYAEDRRQTAFANRQEMANKVMRDAQIDQARRLANNQSWSNFVMEMRNKISQDRNRSLNFLQEQDQLLAQQKMNESLNNFEKEWRDKFAALSEDERKSKNYLDWQDYAIRSDPQAYQKAMTEANLAGQQYLLDNQNKYVNYIFNRVPIIQLLTNNKTVSMPATWHYKKGGKVSSQYTRRHYGPKPDEAIWIQRNKDTAKALEKLHDAVIKLFMKSIS